MINPSGDLIVRPTFIEAAAQTMTPWGEPPLPPLPHPSATLPTARRLIQFGIESYGCAAHYQPAWVSATCQQPT